MWDLPGPGLEPVSPALAGGFLTTVPPGKPHMTLFELWFSQGICPVAGLLGHMVVLFLVWVFFKSLGGGSTEILR